MLKVPATSKVYLSDKSAQPVVHAAILRQTLQIILVISSKYSTLTPVQQVPATSKVYLSDESAHPVVHAAILW